MTLRTAALAFPAALLLAFSSMHAFADPGAYVGLGYGQYSFEFQDDSTGFDDDREVIKVFAGGQFSEAFGLELTYLDFDEAHDSDINAEIEGWSLAGVFSAPLADNFAIYGKLGWFSWETDVRGRLGGTGPVLIEIDESIDGDDLFYGAGVRIGLSDAIALRLEYDRYEIDEEIDPELDILSANLQFGF
ncbi:MAG TPA: outer membrane beta-barrel protein [Gammaproteobacteria bacterium]|jgi:hypothetical protein